MHNKNIYLKNSTDLDFKAYELDFKAYEELKIFQKKFQHYYERFSDHDRAHGFAVKGLDKVQQTIKSLHDEKG